MTRRGLVPLTAFTLVAVALLAGLGFWQLHRLEWKEGLIARIEARTKAKPISLDKAVTLAKEGRNVSYYRVEVEGRYHHERSAISIRSVTGSRAGMSLLRSRPLTATWSLSTAASSRRSSRTRQRVRPDSRKRSSPSSASCGRPKPRHCLSPDNEPGANRWFWRDLCRHGALHVSSAHRRPARAVLPGS